MATGRKEIEDREWKIDDSDPRSSILYSLLLIALLFILSTASFALEVPPLRGRVNDLAGLMPREREHALEERLAAFERETGHQ
ncbi:MAG: hypothetical protein ACREQA_04690, partial [Candidatus Binatia bacterium]